MAGIVHDVENRGLLDEVRQQAAAAAGELAEAAHLRRGQIVVVGCSTSEVVGKKGGQLVHAGGGGRHFRGAAQRVRAHGCVHRRPVLRAPEPCHYRGARGRAHAGHRQCGAPAQGGQFAATATYKACKHPVAVEEIRRTPGWTSAER